jgi:DNA invertase Pin-like site-specific DNA recombinase
MVIVKNQIGRLWMVNKIAKRAAIYLRVSTDGQTTDNQRMELEKVAQHSDWTIVEVYEDAGVSGANGRDKRPAFNQLCLDATRRKFDVVMAWSVDRLGRSLQDLIGFLNELHALDVDLYLNQQGIDTTTPAGRAMFQMLGVFAEFERSMIRERVKAGLQRAKANGKKLGRPGLSSTVKKQIIGLRNTGLSLNNIASEVGVSKGAVYKVVSG